MNAGPASQTVDQHLTFTGSTSHCLLGEEMRIRLPWSLSCGLLYSSYPEKSMFFNLALTKNDFYIKGRKMSITFLIRFAT